MESLRIKELRRKLIKRKNKYIDEFRYVGNLFNIDVNDYLNKYDIISENMVKDIFYIQDLLVEIVE